MKNWVHAPVHIFDEAGSFMVTAGTHNKELIINTPRKLGLLQETLIEKAARFGWILQAWAIFPNHYHFVAISPENPDNLALLIKHVNGSSSFKLNKMDSRTGRKVWFQYWDNRITHQNSYYARLNYVHENPVRHGVVKDAKQYRWCSAARFDSALESEFKIRVYSQGFEGVTVADDFGADLNVPEEE